MIARHGDPACAWMHDNFFVRKGVAELGGARSYASRLFDYGGTGRDQLAWVIDRLRPIPTCRDATITTFEPLTDTSYIPCVSMLDFWRPHGAVELVVYAHGLDSARRVRQPRRARASAAPRRRRARASRRPAAPLVKTAHVYATEWELMARLVEEARATPERG